MEQWKTRANGQTALHVSTWAAYRWANRQPAGSQVKVYKRDETGWRLQETVTADPNNEEN